MNHLGSSYWAALDSDVAVPSESSESLVNNLVVGCGANHKSVAPRSDDAIFASREAKKLRLLTLSAPKSLLTVVLSRYWSLRRFERPEVCRCRHLSVRISNRAR